MSGDCHEKSTNIKYIFCLIYCILIYCIHIHIYGQSIHSYIICHNEEQGNKYNV